MFHSTQRSVHTNHRSDCIWEKSDKQVFTPPYCCNCLNSLVIFESHFSVPVLQLNKVFSNQQGKLSCEGKPVWLHLSQFPEQAIKSVKRGPHIPCLRFAFSISAVINRRRTLGRRKILSYLARNSALWWESLGVLFSGRPAPN